MKRFAADQLSEIPRVLRDDGAVFVEAAPEHDVVGLAETTIVARMNGLVEAGVIQASGQLR